jgi:hypothetical protein
MEGVLLQWLSDLCLSRNVPSIAALPEAFASGYLLGEVLHRHGQCGAFPGAFLEAQDWRGPRGVVYPGPRVEVAYANYSALLPELARLGLACDARTVAALQARAPGAALGLLYELKSRLSALEGEGRGIVGRPRQPGGRALLLQAERLPKPLHQAAGAAALDRALRRLGGSQVARTAAAVVARFTEAPPLRHEAVVRATALAQAGERAARLAAARGSVLAAFAAAKAARLAGEVTGTAAWAAAQARRARDVSYCAERAARESARLAAGAAAALAAGAGDAARGLSETTLVRAAAGIETEPTKGAREALRVGRAPPSTQLPRDDFFAELNRRCGLPGVDGEGALVRGMRARLPRAWRAWRGARGWRQRRQPAGARGAQQRWRARGARQQGRWMGPWRGARCAAGAWRRA